MAKEFKLPDLGEGIHEGEILSVRVSEGDSVKEGDIILEVNRHTVHSVKEAKETIANSVKQDSLLLLVQRNRSTRYIALTA